MSADQQKAVTGSEDGKLYQRIPEATGLVTEPHGAVEAPEAIESYRKHRRTQSIRLRHVVQEGSGDR